MIDNNNNNKTIISNSSKRAFEGLLQLLNLNLSSNALRTIPTDAFIGLPSLRKLDLSHNFLSKLDNKTHGVLDDLLSLEDVSNGTEIQVKKNKKKEKTEKYFSYSREKSSERK